MQNLKIKICQKDETTTKEKRSLTSLTLRRGSGMRDAWKTIGHRDYLDAEHNVFIAYLDNKIVGWALCSSLWSRMEAMFYVSVKHRRKGIGHKLYCAISENYPNEEIMVHDSQQPSVYFFDYCKKKEKGKENRAKIYGVWNID